MRASRLLSIMIILQMRGRVSADALAREFEVSVRTIYRDIDQLSAAGVPVYAERGRLGGFELMEGYRTRLTGLTQAEAEALALAGVGGAARDLGIGAEAAAAQLKLMASLPPDSGASAQRISARFHVDPISWYARAEAIEILPALASAVWKDQRVRVQYESWKDNVTRVLDPLGLVLKGGIWYLVAAVDGKPRTYRVSSIRSLNVLDQGFQRPFRFDLARHWSGSTKEFEERLLGDRAVVKLSPAGVQLLRDVSSAASQAVAADGKPCKPEGWTKARIPVEKMEQAARQLLRLGTDVEVLAPAALRNAIAREARQIAAIHARRQS